MYKYTVYKPRGGDARIKACRELLYSISGDETLNAAVDTYLVDITWVSKMSWRNDTAATQTYAYSYTTSLAITSGSDVNNGFSVGGSFEGMGMSVGHTEKVFKSTETMESNTTTVTISVPPRSTLVCYQKRYHFRQSMFFILDAWGKGWNVGSWGGNALTKKECDVVVNSEEFATLDAELDASRTGTVDVDTVKGTPSMGITRKRENCTERSKAKIGAHVVYIVVVVGRTHMQISHKLRKKQHGPSFSQKCIYLYGPMKELLCIFTHWPIKHTMGCRTELSCGPK